MKRVVLIAAYLSAAAARGAISVGPSGTGIITFDALPPAEEWSTLSIPGGSGSIAQAPDLDAAVETNTVGSFIGLQLDAYSTPTPYPLAGWSSSRHAVFTGPAGVSAELILARLRNNSGTPISSFRVVYDFDVIASYSPIPEEIPGHRVYFSLSGAANSWQLIPELTGDTNIGPHHAVVNVGFWAPGADLYLIWAQDNASHSPDACYLIDNFFAGTDPPPPPCFLSHPASATVAEGQPATFSAAPCISPPYYYQWFRNNAPIAGAHSASLTIPRAHPSDAGAYFVVLSNSTSSASSATATLSVIPDTDPPRALIATLVPDTNAPEDIILVRFSEPMETHRAVDVGNYSLRSANPETFPLILDVTLTNETIARLHVEKLSPNAAYLLTLSNLTDQSDALHSLSPEPTTLAVQAFGPPVVPESYPWKFFEAPTNTTWPGWQNIGFDDRAWVTGPGTFGLPLDEVIPPPFVMRTMIRTPDVGGPVTTYFRTVFNLAPSNTNAVIQLRGVFDEGAIVYINGVEVWRVRLPSGPVTTSTLASNAIEPHVLAGPIEIYAPGLLLPGPNLAAVELHQVTPTSGDAVMGLILGVSQAPAGCAPLLSIFRSDANHVVVNWTCGGILQVAPLLGGPPEFWRDVLTSTNSLTTNLNAGAMFFRVRP